MVGSWTNKQGSRHRSLWILFSGPRGSSVEAGSSMTRRQENTRIHSVRRLAAGLEKTGLLCGGWWLRVRAHPSLTNDQRCRRTHTCTPNSWSFWLRRLAKILAAKRLSTRPLLFSTLDGRKKSSATDAFGTAVHIFGLFLLSDSSAVEYTPPVLCFPLATYQKAASSIL